MNSSTIIESSQQQSVKNYISDFENLSHNESNKNLITNNKWKTSLPTAINLQVGDEIFMKNASIKTVGLSDESIELTGTSADNEQLTDNGIQMEFGYYQSNNWEQNIILPYGVATAQPFGISPKNTTYRNVDFVNNQNKFNIPIADVGGTYSKVECAFWSDYGGPSLGDNLTNVKSLDYYYNSALKLSSFDNIQIAPLILGDFNGESLSALPITENVNIFTQNCGLMTSGNLGFYRPDDQRLYIGNDNWVGFYNNGYSSYHNEAYSTTDYSGIFEIKTSTTDIEISTGFNSPTVIAQQITETLNNPSFENDQFVKPVAIDFTEKIRPVIAGIKLKDVYQRENLFQIGDNTLKVNPTSAGKIIYDTCINGTENFNVVNNSITEIPYPNLEQRSRHMWNCMTSNDYKRTEAITRLYSNLNKSRNIQTLNMNNLDNATYYTGDEDPDKNWAVGAITNDTAYPTSLPYNFGEQQVLFDDLKDFSKSFTAEEVTEKKNYILYKSILETDFNVPNATSSVRQPTTDDRYLDLKPNNVIMSNMVCNDENIEKMKKVIRLLEKPSDNDIDIDFTNKNFEDTLYFSQELGRLNDRDTTSCYNIKNYTIPVGQPNAGEPLYPYVEDGISLPVCLSSPNSVAKRFTQADVPNYTFWNKFVQLPLYAGLFCDENNIFIHNEIEPATTPIYRNITYTKNWRDNKMYQMDYYSRYNENRSPKSGNLILPLIEAAPGQPQPLQPTNFKFTDNFGNYYDDTKLKEENIGMVVAYRNLVEESAEVLQFGLGSIPTTDAFSFYSVDTTATTYTKNNNIYVNVSPVTSQNVLADNSLSIGDGGTTNSTLFLSQNSGTTYSNTVGITNIEAQYAPVIEYDAIDLIRPSSFEMFQSATLPKAPLVPTPVTENLFGGPVGDGTHSLTTNMTLTGQSNIYNNEIYNSYSYSSNAGTGYTGIEWYGGEKKVVERLRVWFGQNQWNNLGYYPQIITIHAYDDSSTYNVNDPTTFELLFFEEFIPISDYNNVPWVTSSTAPLSASGLTKCKDINLTSPNGYKFLKILWSNGFSGSPYVVVSQIVIDGKQFEETQSRFPKKMIVQARANETVDWTTLSTQSKLSQPYPAGFNGSTYPSNPPISGIIAPYQSVINSLELKYRFFRFIFPETFNTRNTLSIGELVLKKNNSNSILWGDNIGAFNEDNLILKIKKANHSDYGGFVNIQGGLKTNIQNGLLSVSASKTLNLSLNSTPIYNPTLNRIAITPNSYLSIMYNFTIPTEVNGFSIFRLQTAANPLPPQIKRMSVWCEGEDGVLDEIFDKNQNWAEGVSTTDSIQTSAPFVSHNFNDSIKKYKNIEFRITETYVTGSNLCWIGNILLRQFNLSNIIQQNVPFLGYVCREQISSKDKYNIPLPIEGEFLGLSPSYQNNLLSYTYNPQKIVKGQGNRRGLGNITIEKNGEITMPTFVAPTVTLVGSSGILTAEWEQIAEVVGTSVTYQLKSLRITDQDTDLIQAPSILFTPPTPAPTTYTAPEAYIALDELKNSYNVKNTNYPYIMIGANDMTMEFNTKDSRLAFQNLHTETVEGQNSNNMLRFYEGVQNYNTNAGNQIIPPDDEAGNKVIKFNKRRFEVNSARAGFSEGTPKQLVIEQIIPTENKAIASLGASSSVGGVGLLNIKVKKKDGTYENINNDNLYTYKGTLLDKCGFNINQLLPKFGNQNRFFNRGLYNKYITSNKNSLNQYNSVTLPFTTNGFLAGSFNNSLNVNNLGYIMNNNTGNNKLEKTIAQTTDQLLALKLPEKFSYSHLLVYTNLLQKNNYIGGPRINNLSCIGSISRNYQTGDFIFLAAPTLPYVIDLVETITEVEIEIRNPNGELASIDSGSTIFLQINQKKPIPLVVKN